RHVDVSQSADIADKLDYQGFLLMEMVRQYTPVGAALAGFGLIRQWRRFSLAIASALLAGWLGSSLVLGAMLGFDYEPLMKAALFVHGDDDSFPIGYMNRVEGFRPDVTLYNDEGLLFRNRLFRFDAPDKGRQLSAFVRGSERRIYYASAGLPHEFSMKDGGLY